MTCDTHCLPADYTETQEAVRVSVPVTEGTGPLAVSPRITQRQRRQQRCQCLLLKTPIHSLSPHGLHSDTGGSKGVSTCHWRRRSTRCLPTDYAVESWPVSRGWTGGIFLLQTGGPCVRQLPSRRGLSLAQPPLVFPYHLQFQPKSNQHVPFHFSKSGLRFKVIHYVS